MVISTVVSILKQMVITNISHSLHNTITQHYGRKSNYKTLLNINNSSQFNKLMFQWMLSMTNYKTVKYSWGCNILNMSNGSKLGPQLAINWRGLVVLNCNLNFKLVLSSGFRNHATNDFSATTFKRYTHKVI